MYIGCRGGSCPKTDIVLRKKRWQVLNNPDRADFIRVVSDPDSGRVLFTLKIFLNGFPKLARKTATCGGMQIEGQCSTFYPSGKRKKIKDRCGYNVNFAVT